MYVGRHVVRIGETDGPVGVWRLVHGLDAHVTGSNFAGFLRRAVRVAEPGGRRAGHRVAAPVDGFVERRVSVRLEPHVHGPEVAAVDLDARAGRLLALQVHELGGLDRGEGHTKVGNGHRVPGHPAHRERRLAAGRRRI